MKVLVVVGTRPEAIKMAPVVGELRRRTDDFEVEVCLTAQHRELLDQVIGVFGITVDYDLDLMRPDQSIFDVTSRVLVEMGDVLTQAKPDVVLVHGDTTTTSATVGCVITFARIISSTQRPSLPRSYRRIARPNTKTLKRQSSQRPVGLMP